MAKAWSRFGQEDVVNVRRDGVAERLFQFRTHLLKKRRYGAIFLYLLGVVERCDVMAVQFQNVAKRIFQHGRQDIESAYAVTFEEASKAPTESVDQIVRHEWAVPDKSLKCIFTDIIIPGDILTRYLNLS